MMNINYTTISFNSIVETIANGLRLKNVYKEKPNNIYQTIINANEFKLVSPADATNTLIFTHIPTNASIRIKKIEPLNDVFVEIVEIKPECKRRYTKLTDSPIDVDTFFENLFEKTRTSDYFYYNLF